MTAPPVIRLFQARCPTAVFWTILAIVVLAFYRLSWWGKAHIRKEIFKPKPADANGNPATTIVPIITVLGIPAPLDHVRPNTIGFAFESDAGVAVGAACRAEQCRLLTATGFSVPSDQRADTEDSNFSAATSAEGAEINATTASPDPARVRYYFKVSKGLSDKGYCARHGIGSFNVVFSGGQPAATGSHYDNPMMLKKSQGIS